MVSSLNMFGSSTPILFVVFVETIGVFWFYGVSRYRFNITTRTISYKGRRRESCRKCDIGLSAIYSLHFPISSFNELSILVSLQYTMLYEIQFAILQFLCLYFDTLWRFGLLLSFLHPISSLILSCLFSPSCSSWCLSIVLSDHFSCIPVTFLTSSFLQFHHSKLFCDLNAVYACRFCDDVELMLGRRPALFWRICWQYISPIFLAVGAV